MFHRTILRRIAIDAKPPLSLTFRNARRYAAVAMNDNDKQAAQPPRRAGAPIRRRAPQASAMASINARADAGRRGERQRASARRIGAGAHRARYRQGAVMPNRAPMPCGRVGCSALVVGGGRCPRHKTPATVVAGARWYGQARWRRERRIFLQYNPLCVACAARGVATPADEVNHIQPHAGNAALFFDVGNWQALCASCHSTKTANEDGGFGRIGWPGQITDTGVANSKASPSPNVGAISLHGRKIVLPIRPT